MVNDEDIAAIKRGLHFLVSRKMWEEIGQIPLMADTAWMKKKEKEIKKRYSSILDPLKTKEK